jgi:aryl-alcohol dehydrogenase-like predicted oxidoreductase
MQFTKFGQTGLTVSRMILGTGTFGSKRMKKRRIECSIRRLRQGLTSSIPLTYIPLARRSVVLKSS